MAEGVVTALYRYPVKGFSAESLDSAPVAKGGAMPLDRAFAVENGPSGFDPWAPAYRPKSRYLMLMRDERMAEFATRFDDATGMFRIFRNDILQAEGVLSSEAGRAGIEAWIAATFRAELRGRPRILSAPGHSFSDKSAKVLHLVNLASVRALEDAIGRRVDPLRFRPNIVIDGVAAWEELEWEGAALRFPNLSCKVESRTTRCAATNVEPASGRRDMDIPGALTARYGHMDFGVYLIAKAAGRIAVGDSVEAPG